MTALRDRLKQARLYLMVDARTPEELLRGALRGGVDVLQLRDKQLGDDEIVTAARFFRRVCDEFGALFVLNDRPDLVAACGSDGVHVGQEDATPSQARSQVGDDRIVGLSTHSGAQIEAATDVDYIGVGPVFATPTKPGRPAVGLPLVTTAACLAPVPFFAIGGIDEANVRSVVAAGAQRLAVVRAIRDADDPERAARALRSYLPA